MYAYIHKSPRSTKLQNRYKRLVESLRGKVDSILIANRDFVDPNFFYLTGYTSGLFEGSMAVLDEDARVSVLTSRLEAGIAKQYSHRVTVLERYGEKEVSKQVNALLKNSKTVGLNYRGISYLDYKFLRKILGDRKIVDISKNLAQTRLIKDPDEVALIKKAVDITSTALEKLPDIVHVGMSEKEVQAEIESTFVREGAEGPAYSSIVAFGENSALPHYFSGERKLKKGDTILADVGARYKLYCADLTRTFFFGKPTKLQEEMYDTVYRAQEASMKLIRDGVEGKLVHEEAEKLIDSTKFKGKFIHGLGHSIGVEVHDGGGMGKSSTQPLRENMVVTVEPGVYIEGKGGVRIEDDVVVGASGYTLLSTYTREMQVI